MRRDGSTYHDLNATFADLVADDDLDAVILARNGACVVAKIPDGATPFFLRRCRATVPLDGTPVDATEFAACIGWERDGRYSLAWLMHDGSVCLTDRTDLDEVSR